MASPQGVNLGNAEGTVTISPDGVTAGLNEAYRQIGNFIGDTGRMMQQWGNGIRNVGQALGTAIFPATAIGGYGVKVAADFDSVMREIQARTGLTDEAMQEIASTAKDLGAATVFSAQQTSEAFLQLLTAGLDTKQALATLPAVLDAAAAGNIDLGQAADLVTNVMSAFNLKADDTTKIIDAMTRASASSPVTMGQMGEALSTAGGVARQFGLDVEQTSAALAILANEGLRGSEGGNALTRVLNNMSRDVPEVKAAWEELGVSLYDANGNVRDMDAVFGDLRVAMNKLPMEEQIRLTQKLAGMEGQRAFNALLASDGIDAMTEKMREQQSAHEVAMQQMESFSNQVNSLKGSFEILMIDAMTPFMNDVLVPLIKQGIEVVNGIRDWVNENQELVKTVATVIAIVALIASGMIAFGQTLIIVGGLIAALATPIGLVTLAVGALVTAFVTDFGGIRTKLQPILDGLIKQLTVVAAWFQNFGIGKGVQLLFTTFEDGSNVIGEFLHILGMTEEQSFAVGDAINRVVNFIAGLFNRVRAIVQTFFSNNPFEAMANLIESGFSSQQSMAIVRFLYTLRDNVGAIISQVIDNWSRLFSAISDAWTNTLQPALDNLFSYFNGGGEGGSGVDGISIFGQALEGVRWLLEQFGTVVTQYIVPALASFIAFIIDNIPVAFEFIQSAWNDVLKPALTAIGDFIVNTVLPALGRLYSWFVVEALPVISQAAQNAWNNYLQPMFSAIGSFIVDTVMPALGQFYNWFVTDALPAILDFINTTVIPGFNTFIGILADIWTAIQPALASVYDWFVTTGLPAILDFVNNFVIPGVNTLIGIIKDIWTVIQPGLASFYDWFITTGLPAIVSFIQDTVLPGITNLIDTIKNIWTEIQPALDSLKTGFENVFNWILDNVITPFLNSIGGIGNTINDALNLVGLGTQNAPQTGAAPPSPQAMLGAGSQTKQADPAKVADVQRYSGILQKIASGSVDVNKALQAFMQSGQMATEIGRIFGQSLQAMANGVDMMKVYQDFSAIAQKAVYLAQGTNFVPNITPAILHPGEAVIPANMNPYNPNAQSNGLGEKIVFDKGAIFIESIHANNAAEGAKAGAAFGDAFMEKLRAEGVELSS